MERNRDLMYVARANKNVGSEREIDYLHRILSSVETLGKLCTCTEIIDLTQFRVITSKHHVLEILRNSELKPFQFIHNKN